ncbi:aspartate/glutamate racemase family protein [Virgibacillus salexigens]|uniref:aspartate/glutamate racemase family protein n=1 Tax=Virgibacillus salexigens TaxID=61016 RepID=UPI00190A1D48|nr:aspartate/glutamate racemase family protein [Virgibacillus salexigens]
MRTIGLLGGMSWESSATYYALINKEVKTRLGGLHSASCIMYSVDFHQMERYQSTGKWEKAGQLLANAARSLEQAGASFIILCTNTMHKVVDMIQAAITIPVLHIADATAKTIKQKGMKNVGLLGTAYTMEQDFYKSRLEEHGIHVVIPDQEERRNINDIIFNELCLGHTHTSSRAVFQKVINELIEQEAEGVILGCTEIGMLLKSEDVILPIFDTTTIHALEAVNQSLKGGIQLE